MEEIGKTVPPLPGLVAPRHSLLNLFYRASAGRLSYVQAPAGSGKTVSTHLWLTHSGRQGYWIQLASRHNSASVFYRQLAHELAAGLDEDLSAFVAQLNFDSAPMESMGHLCRAMVADNCLRAVVIDDFHLITNEEIQRTLPEFLSALPPNFVSIIISRTCPPNAARYLPKSTTFIKAADLAFTTDEISWLFKASGHQIQDVDAMRIRKNTHGWAMGVSSLAISGQTSAGRGQSKVVEAYLWQVWQRLDNELQEFLLKMSVAEEISPGLARCLSGIPHSQEILLRLYREGMFVTMESPDVFQCHQLFRDFLLRQLEEHPHIDSARLYCQAAAFCRGQGQWYESLRYAGLGRDRQGVQQAMLQLYKYTTTLNSVSEHASRLKSYLLDWLPDDFLQENPFLLINHIWYYYLMGQAEPMLRYLDMFYANFEYFRRHYQEFLVLGLLITTLDFRKKATGIVLEVQVEHGPEQEQNEVMQTATMTENMPFMHRSNQDYSQLAFDLPAGLDAFAQAFGAILGPDILTLTTSGLKAGILYEQNRIVEAEEEVLRTIAALKPHIPPELKMAARLLQAAIYFAQQRMDEFNAVLTLAKQTVRQDNAQYLTPNLLALETKFNLMDGSQTAAENWLGHYFVTHPQQPEFYKLYQHLATARAYLVLDDTDMALTLLRKLNQLGIEYNRPLDQAECQALLAATHWALGQPKPCLQLLRDTVELMFPYGFVRVFAIEGSAIVEPLKMLCQENKDEKLAPYLNAIYLASQQAGKHNVTRNVNMGKVKLSKQQSRILTLLAQGMKQKNIARAIGLSHPTVKSHTLALYKKLKVNSGKNAVIRARELGLLD